MPVSGDYVPVSGVYVPVSGDGVPTMQRDLGSHCDEG